jgi:hypothetical protein
MVKDCRLLRYLGHVLTQQHITQQTTTQTEEREEGGGAARQNWAEPKREYIKITT